MSLGVTVAAAVPDGLFALWLGVLANGLRNPEAPDRARLILAGCGLGFSCVGGWLLRAGGDRLHMRFRQRLAVPLETHVPRLQATAPGIEQHERPDGHGYPFALKAGQICAGAGLLAVIDAFEAMTHERGDRYHKKSIVRTISEINACEGQFGREWIEPFNKVIRRMLAQ